MSLRAFRTLVAIARYRTFARAGEAIGLQTALSGPLPDALLALRDAHPSLRVHVSAGMSAELANRVAAGELDAAITTRPVRPHPAELTWTTLYEDRFWLLAPPQYAGRDAGTLPEARRWRTAAHAASARIASHRFGDGCRIPPRTHPCRVVARDRRIPDTPPVLPAASPKTAYGE